MRPCLLALESIFKLLTVVHARRPTASKSILLSSCVAAPSRVSMSSAPTPLDSRKATFFSRGASRIAGSSRNREACSSNCVLSESSKSPSVGTGASTTGGFVSTVSFSLAGSDSGSGVDAAGFSVDAFVALCHAGILGLSDMTMDEESSLVHGKQKTMFEGRKQARMRVLGKVGWTEARAPAIACPNWA